MQCVVPQVTHFAEALPLVKAVWTDNKGSDNPRRDSFFFNAHQSNVSRRKRYYEARCHQRFTRLERLAFSFARARWKKNCMPRRIQRTIRCEN